LGTGRVEIESMGLKSGRLLIFELNKQSFDLNLIHIEALNGNVVAIKNYNDMLIVGVNNEIHLFDMMVTAKDIKLFHKA
jgi:hypothetical protein